MLSIMSLYRDLVHKGVRLTDDEINDLRTKILNRPVLDCNFFYYRAELIALMHDQQQVIREIIALERAMDQANRHELSQNTWILPGNIRHLIRAARSIEDVELMIDYLEYLKARYLNNLDRVPQALRTSKAIGEIKMAADYIDNIIESVSDRWKRARLIRARTGQHRRFLGTIARKPSQRPKAQASQQQQGSMFATGGTKQGAKAPASQQQQRSPLQNHLQRKPSQRPKAQALQQQQGEDDLTRSVARTVINPDTFKQDMFKLLSDMISGKPTAKRGSKTGGAAQNKKKSQGAP